MAYMGNIAQIPLGQMGVVSDLPPGSIPYGALIRSINIDYGPGYLQKAPGAIRYNSAYPLSSGVVACLDYWPDVNTQRLLTATADGKIFKDYGDRTFQLATAVKTGLGSLTNSSQFVIGGNETAGASKKIFFFSGGVSQVQVCPGDQNTFLPISNPAADWPNPTASSNPQSNFPKFGLIHRGSLWAFAKSVAYKSNPANHEDFQTTNAILINNVGPGEGGDIVGAFVYKSRLFVFKQGDFVYYLNDTDNSSTNWYFTKFSEGFGIANWHSGCQVLDDYLVGNVTNTITSYQATQNFGSVVQGDIFKKARVSQYFRGNTTPAGTPFQQAMFYPEKGLALFTAKTKYRQNNDGLIQIDVSDPSQPKYGFWNHLAPDCLNLRRDLNNIPRPMYGASDGYIYLMDREDRSVGAMGSGSAYTGEFKTAYTNLGWLDANLTHKTKNWDFLGVTFTPEGNHNLSVDVWIDGRFSETITFSMTQDSNYLGAFQLGTSILGGAEEEFTIIKPLHGMGREISFRGYNSVNNENFRVSKFTIGFRPGDEQAMTSIT